MRSTLTAVLGVCAALTTTVSPAAGQERGDTGIAMGYPSTVAVQWHATERVAVRFDVTLSLSSTEHSSGTYSSSIDTWGVALGAGPVFYLATTGNLRTYVSPRFTWGRTETEGQPFSGIQPRTTSRTLGFTGSFGAQYAFSNRFSAYGEVGATYSSLHGESDPGTSESNGHGFATRSAVGVILYF